MSPLNITKKNRWITIQHPPLYPPAACWAVLPSSYIQWLAQINYKLCLISIFWPFRIQDFQTPQKKIWKDMKYIHIIHILFILYIYTYTYIPNSKPQTLSPLQMREFGEPPTLGKFFIGRPPANVAKQVTWTSHSPDRQISTWKLGPWNHSTKTV